MKNRVNLVSFCWIAATLLALAACAHAPVATHSGLAAEPAPASTERQARVPGEYLVRLVSGEDEGVISEHYDRFGIKDVNALGDETFLLILSNDPGPQEMEALVRDDSRVVAVQPNLIFWTNRSGRIAK